MKLISRLANINFKFAKPTSHKVNPTNDEDQDQDQEKDENEDNDENHDQVDKVETERLLTVWHTSTHSLNCGKAKGCHIQLIPSSDCCCCCC